MTATDPTRDVLVTLPGGWRRQLAPSSDVLVAARADVLPASGVRPRLALRCESVAGDPELWVRRRLGDLARRLVGFALEDDARLERDDGVVHYHRYAYRAEGRDHVVERWAWVVDGVGLVLTGTTAREDHLVFSEVFEAVAGTVELVPALPRTA